MIAWLDAGWRVTRGHGLERRARGLTGTLKAASIAGWRGVRRAVGLRKRFGLCAIAKDEAPYVREWVAYHLAIGFQHITIYDNDSSDGLAERFRDCPLPISIVPWPTVPGRSPQREAYRHFMTTRGRDIDWVAFLDIDEFLNLKTRVSIGDLIDRCPGADAIGFNWRMFGSASRQRAEEGLVIDRFTRASCEAFAANFHIKTIARADHVVLADVHNSTYRPGTRFVTPNGTPLIDHPNARQSVLDLSIAQVNHYFTKSREEFAAKRLRGRADVAPEDEARFRTDIEFDIYDRNEEEDLTILRWRPQLLRMLERLP